MRRTFSFLAVLLLAAFAPPALAQTDIIRGKITGPDSQAVANANIKVISYTGQVTKTTKTDRRGGFTIVYQNGEGDYWVEITAIGYLPKRFEIKRIGDEEVLIADTRLQINNPTLDPVNVTANAPRALPPRNANAADAGGGDRNLPVTGVPPDLAGNLAAMASAIPGIQLIPGMDGATDMFSALGLGGDQNNMSFNGLGSSFSALPQDAQVGASFNQNPVDPAIGGFSGARISMQTFPGSNFSRRNMSGGAITPESEWADAQTQQAGQEYTRLNLGGGFGGPLTMDKRFYNGSWSYGRYYNDLQTLLNTSALGLSGAGIARDSADRLLNILSGLNIPVRAAQPTDMTANDDARIQANFDLSPSASGAGSSYTLGIVGNYGRQQNMAGGNVLSTVPASMREQQSINGTISLSHVKYFWFGVLTKSSFGVSTTRTDVAPYLRLPQGQVRVASALDDRTSAVRNLVFGGNPSESDNRATNVQITNSLNWYSGGNKHSLKLTSSLIHESFDNFATQNTLGTFTFNSLADLEAGRADRFFRTLNPVEQNGRQLIGAMSFGDYWRPNVNTQVTAGFRLDGNRILHRPDYNPAVFEAFGVRNDNVSNRVYISPRLGVQWYTSASPTIALMPGAARPPRSVVHAGVGMFQNMGGVTQFNDALSLTGLPSGIRSISCVGPAAPSPTWSDFLNDPASIPTQCADGSAGTVFSTGAPQVSLYSAGYQQYTSWRGWADWSGAVLDNRFVFGIQGIYNYATHQPSVSDLNLQTTERFALDNEANRPVYTRPTAIVPTTGSVAIADSRINPAFQRVSMRSSDFHSETRQLQLNLKQVTANPKLYWNLFYTFTDYREDFNGFNGGSTIGSPFTRGWSQGQQGGRHQLSFQWNNFPIFDLIYVSANVSLNSGQKYTPMVSGDVNGDGVSNDRAFIFDPAATPDTAVAGGLDRILTNGSSSARECLMKQLGQLAGRATCQAPWYATAGLGFRFNPQKIGLPKRLSISFNIQNPLALADRVINGQDDMRGWGQRIQPNQDLLFVRGFDPATQRFKYEVNERFGSTRPSQVGARIFPYMSLNLGFDIGAPRERQTLTQNMDRGRKREGTKYNAQLLKMLGTQSIPNPMALILQQPDTLKLTRRQADSLASLSRAYTLYADSLWTPTSRQLEAMPNDYSRDEAFGKFIASREKTVDYLIKIVPHVRNLLTKEQKRKLPMQVLNLLDVRVLKFLRTSSAGAGGSPIFR